MWPFGSKTQTQPSPSNARNTPPQKQPNKEFDKKAFCEYVNDFGRAYQFRAKRLIDLCRCLPSNSKQSFRQDAALSNVLARCDAAVKGAVKSRNEKTCPELDYLFGIAARGLMDYAKDFCHDGGSTAKVKSDMENAEEKDKKNKHKRWNDSENVSVVEFYICSTLPCSEPTIVQQALSSNPENSQIEDVLWNFSHFDEKSKNCLALTQTPQFYLDLPKVADSYTASKFKRERMSEKYHEKRTIYVLRNSSCRVFVEHNGETRMFDNIWVIENKLIFRDVCGTLESETGITPSPFIQKSSSFFYHETVTKGQPKKVKKWEDVLQTLRRSPPP